MTTTPELFCVCDIETTGLFDMGLPKEPWSESILEVGLLLVTPELEEVDAISSLVLGLQWKDNLEAANPHVKRMHDKSGLWAELDMAELQGRSSELDELHVADRLVDWLSDRSALGLPMMGSSLALDRNFLQLRMRRLYDAFHYRNIDVSTLKELARVWAPAIVFENASIKTHRVLDDCRTTVAELKHYRDKGFIGLGISGWDDHDFFEQGYNAGHKAGEEAGEEAGYRDGLDEGLSQKEIWQ